MTPGDTEAARTKHDGKTRYFHDILISSIYCVKMGCLVYCSCSQHNLPLYKPPGIHNHHLKSGSFHGRVAVGYRRREFLHIYFWETIKSFLSNAINSTAVTNMQMGLMMLYEVFLFLSFTTITA